MYACFFNYHWIPEPIPDLFPNYLIIYNNSPWKQFLSSLPLDKYSLDHLSILNNKAVVE